MGKRKTTVTVTEELTGSPPTQSPRGPRASSSTDSAAATPTKAADGTKSMQETDSSGKRAPVPRVRASRATPAPKPMKVMKAPTTPQMDRSKEAPQKRPSARCACENLGARKTRKKPSACPETKTVCDRRSAKDLAEGILDDNACFLLEKIESCASSCQRLLQNMGSWPRPIRIATACSGSEVTSLAFTAWARRCGTRVPPIRIEFDFVFTCEKDKTKQEWLLLNELQGGHLFHAIEDLSNDKALCHAHQGCPDFCLLISVSRMFCTFVFCIRNLSCKALGASIMSSCVSRQLCMVPSADGFVYGFSCKSVSAVNSYRMTHQGALAEGTDRCSTVTTFNGGLAWVAKHRPLFVLMENVLGLATEDSNDDAPALLKKSNLDIVKDKYRRIGYDVQAHVINSAHFKLPQRRRRIYIFAVRLDTTDYPISIHSLSSVQSDVELLLKSFKEQELAMKVEDFLLEDDHPAVQEALAQLKKAEMKRDPAFAEWKHVEFCKSQKVGWPLVIKNKKLKDSEWVKAMSPRQVDCIAFVEAKCNNT